MLLPSITIFFRHKGLIWLLVLVLEVLLQQGIHHLVVNVGKSRSLSSHGKVTRYLWAVGSGENGGSAQERAHRKRGIYGGKGGKGSLKERDGQGPVLVQCLQQAESCRREWVFHVPRPWTVRAANWCTRSEKPATRLRRHWRCRFDPVRGCLGSRTRWRSVVQS